MIIIIEPVDESGTTVLTIDGEPQTFGDGDLGHVRAFHAAAAALAGADELVEEPA